jgi:four helix bundle protein
MDLLPVVYELLKQLPRNESYALSDQIRRAALSIPANIAEGQARQHKKEFIQHLSIARGSLAELDTLLLAGQRLGYWPINDRIDSQLLEIRRLLQGLIRSLRR